MLNNLHQTIQINCEIMTYVDTLLDQQPTSFFTISNKIIVYTNKTFNQFLQDKVFSIDLEANNPTDTKLIVNEFEDCNFKMLGCQFLSHSRLNYMNETVKKILADMGEVNIETKTVQEIINIIETLPKGTYGDGRFFFLGISEFLGGKTDGKIYHSINIRIVNINKITLLEVFMVDVTLSKKIQTMNEMYKVKESLLSKIAHEFKTPLICIVTLSEQINKYLNKTDTCIIKSKHKEKLSQINDLSNYTLFLINDITNYLSVKLSSNSLNIRVDLKW